MFWSYFLTRTSCGIVQSDGARGLMELPTGGGAPWRVRRPIRAGGSILWFTCALLLRKRCSFQHRLERSSGPIAAWLNSQDRRYYLTASCVFVFHSLFLLVWWHESGFAGGGGGVSHFDESAYVCHGPSICAPHDALNLKIITKCFLPNLSDT